MRALGIAGVVLLACALFDFSLVPTIVIAVVALVIFVYLPWRSRNRFRLRMTRVKQGVRKDIREGKLARQKLPWRVFGLADGGVKEARDVTMLQVMTFRLVLPRYARENWTQAAESEWKNGIRKMKNMNPRNRLRNYERQWKNLVVVHLFIGTPFGWLVGGAATLWLGLVLLARLITRPSIRLAKLAIRDRLLRTREGLAMIVRYGIQPKPQAKNRESGAPAVQG